MADDIKKVKDDIWRKKKAIEGVEAERESWATQLPGILALLENSPNPEIEELKVECEKSIAGYDKQLGPLREELAALEAKLPKAPEPAAPKFDPEKHPLLKKNLEKAEPAKPIIYNTGDIVEAQWTDKQWYKAKIQTILGAASAPKYHVKFLEYDDTMTVDRDSVRPTNKRKRDTEPAAIAHPVAPVTSTPHVISGPASKNPVPQTAKKDHENGGSEKKIRKTVGSQKRLEKNMNNWKEWNSKGPGKKIAKKESMFRSGTSVTSRVGFTGSGAGMTETYKRVRHTKKPDSDDTRLD